MANDCTTPKPSMSRTHSLKVQDLRLDDLSETGRVQFFYHSPLSEYPVRDVTNEQGHGWKLEPHIEKHAENYYDRCYQNNIAPFARSDEKYLFLFTTCKKGEYCNRRLIVGYIVKENAFLRPDRCEQGFHVAVQGDTKLYSFRDAFPLERLVKSRIRGMKKFNPDETKIILDHFRGKKNILAECIIEINRLERDIL